MTTAKEDSTNSTTLNARRAPIPLTPKQREIKQKKFLKAFCEIGIVKYACKVAGINRSTYKYWRDHDKAFSEQLEEAKEEANESLEYAAHEQAVIGVFEPVVSMGRPVYDEIPVLDEKGEPVLDEKGRPKVKRGDMLMRRALAPSLLQTLLKANMPEKYKDKQKVELTGKDGGDIIVETFWGRGTDPRRKEEHVLDEPRLDKDPAATIEEDLSDDEEGDAEFSIAIPDDDDEEL